MNRNRIWKIVSVFLTVFCLITGIHAGWNTYEIKQECKRIYEKEVLTADDLKSESTYKTRTEIFPGEEGKAPPEEIRFKKLYGIEYIGCYEINKNGGIEVEFTSGKAKLLILDKNGQQKYYEEIEAPESVSFEPGGAGKYDIYIVGVKSTVRVLINTY